MKRIATLACAMLLSAAAPLLAADGATTVVRQLIESERDLLPEKAVEVKLQRVSLAGTPLAAAVDTLLAGLAGRDFNHHIYALRVAPGDPVAVTVDNLSALDGLAADKRAAAGVLLRGSVCVVVLAPVPAGLLGKAKGRHTLVQEYEIVEERIERSPTHIEAVWNGEALSVASYSVNGEQAR